MRTALLIFALFSLASCKLKPSASTVKETPPLADNISGHMVVRDYSNALPVGGSVVYAKVEFLIKADPLTISISPLDPRETRYRVTSLPLKARTFEDDILILDSVDEHANIRILYDTVNKRLSSFQRLVGPEPSQVGKRLEVFYSTTETLAGYRLHSVVTNFANNDYEFQVTINPPPGRPFAMADMQEVDAEGRPVRMGGYGFLKFPWSTNADELKSGDYTIEDLFLVKANVPGEKLFKPGDGLTIVLHKNQIHGLNIRQQPLKLKKSTVLVE